MSNEKDLNRIFHIVRAIEEAMLFTKNVSLKEFKKDRKLVLAIVKEIEIAGEAASKVSESFKNRYPSILWKELIATRNRLIHGYFDIHEEVVWNTLQQDFKQLLKDLKKIK